MASPFLQAAQTVSQTRLHQNQREPHGEGPDGLDPCFSKQTRNTVRRVVQRKIERELAPCLFHHEALSPTARAADKRFICPLVFTRRNLCVLVASVRV